MQSQALVLGSMQHFSKQFHHGLRSSASLTCRRDTHVGPRERTKGTPDTRVGEGERASEWQAPGRDGQTTIATLGPSPRPVQIQSTEPVRFRTAPAPAPGQLDRCLPLPGSGSGPGDPHRNFTGGSATSHAWHDTTASARPSVTGLARPALKRSPSHAHAQRAAYAARARPPAGAAPGHGRRAVSCLLPRGTANTARASAKPVRSRGARGTPTPAAPPGRGCGTGRPSARSGPSDTAGSDVARAAGRR